MSAATTTKRVTRSKKTAPDTNVSEAVSEAVVPTTATEVVEALPKRITRSVTKNATKKAAMVAATAAVQQEPTSKEQYIMDTYKQKDSIQHILDPQTADVYMGSIAMNDKDMHIFDDEQNKIVVKHIEFIPGLFKLFDEAIVNARDHVIRMERLKARIAAGEEQRKQAVKPVTYIAVEVAEDGTIIITNDGNGVDVCWHAEREMWVPEMIFAHLLSGANFDKDDSDIIGGKNGMGIKLAFIWSTYAAIETVDHDEGKRYFQEFRDNRAIIGEPQITKMAKSVKPFTRVTFKPDYTRFGIPDGLTTDVRALFKKRTYDIAAVSGVTVTFNGAQVPVKNFAQYLDFYVGDKTSAARVYEENGEHWEYAVALSPTNTFQQVSFVNGIHTSRGGTHVNYIVSQITERICEIIKQKRKLDVKPATIKEQLIVFVRCNITKPKFDSQSKDTLTSNIRTFGSTCQVSEKFIDKIAKMGVIEAACAIENVRMEKRITSAIDGKKRSRVNVDKLIDAEHAGTAQSHTCTLILCEGDSAKAGVVSGLPALSATEIARIGVYPMKGKVLNTRNSTMLAVSKNKEITDIMEILGLKTGVTYTQDTVKQQLRYARVVVLCDSDVDGSHIKGLIINMFHSLWPSLALMPGFLSFMNTPILTATKGDTVIQFFNQGEYNTWRAGTQNTHTWTIKYYKGLGSSVPKEWIGYFANARFIDYFYSGQLSDLKIDMAFNEKKTDQRKDWLGTYDRAVFLNTSATSVSYEDFIQYELIHFSSYDNIRSIPSVVDGLKPSQRKVLYGVFKRNLTTEVKVAQLTGYVAEQTEYHHGEVSLQSTIIGLAQNFVGSNNINLLSPDGQFGTRMQGGNDAASPRYIFTKLTKDITRTLFPKEDEPVLQYLEEDGKNIEPLYYVPLLPMVLINGAKGIGTGYSTELACYNPRDLVAYLRARLLAPIGVDAGDFEFVPVPYYEGFKGTIVPIGAIGGSGDGESAKYLIMGTYTVLPQPDTIVVTELPVGFWTEDFKKHLEWLRDEVATTATAKDDDKKRKSKSDTMIDQVKDFVIKTSTSEVYVTVQFYPGKLAELEAQRGAYEGTNGVHKLLKLATTVSTTNMCLFSADDRLRRYANVKEIADEHYEVRLDYYERRKRALIVALERTLLICNNRVRFIQENIAGTVDLRRKTAQAIETMLVQKKYDKDAKPMPNAPMPTPTFDYLTEMPLATLSEDKVAKLEADRDAAAARLAEVRATTAAQFWIRELDNFEQAYEKYLIEREEQITGANGNHAADDKTKTVKGGRKIKPAASASASLSASATPAATTTAKGKTTKTTKAKK